MTLHDGVPTRPPVPVPRWVFTAYWAGLTLGAVLILIRDWPILPLSVLADYDTVWTVAIGVGGVVATVGSLLARWERVEMHAALWLSSWLPVLAVTAAIQGRYPGAVFYVILLLLPATRAGTLLAQWVRPAFDWVAHARRK